MVQNNHITGRLLRETQPMEARRTRQGNPRLQGPLADARRAQAHLKSEESRVLCWAVSKTNLKASEPQFTCTTTVYFISRF